MGAKRRVAAFIDGFNLYHAIDRLKKPHLKWLDISKLTSIFIDPALHEISAIYYFSAFATWRQTVSRHQEYVKALNSVGVSCVMGHFKNKDRSCFNCGSKWVAHEEKETDVNIALYLLNEGYKDSYDLAFLITQDSDIVPAVKMSRISFPNKSIRIISPPGFLHSKELVSASGSKAGKIKEIHLERSLFPENVICPHTGVNLAKRPVAYCP